MVPLCYSCHKAVTLHESVLSTVGREHKRGGRKKKKWPENTDAVFMDFVRCRISKKECCDRLNIGDKFTADDRFKLFKADNQIVKCRNNIDTKLSTADSIQCGAIVGRIEYADGSTELLYWGHEEPISGETDVPTKDIPDRHDHQTVKEYILPFK